MEKDLKNAFDSATKAGSQAFLTLTDPFLQSHRQQIVDFAAKSRLPAIHPDSEYVEAGGLMSYAPNALEYYTRAATYVDKILKGVKPADLPVGAANKVRVRHQSKNREADRIGNTPKRIGQSR